MTPVGLSTPVSVYTVTNVYNYQTVNGAGTTNMVALELKDSSDNPVNVENTGSPTSGGTTLGWACRRVSDPTGKLSGARLFKTVWNDTQTGCYALVFNTPADNADYVPIINPSGLWAYGHTNGRYPQWHDQLPDDDNAYGYTSKYNLQAQMGSTKTVNGFTFMTQHNTEITYDARLLNILVMS